MKTTTMVFLHFKWCIGVAALLLAPLFLASCNSDDDTPGVVDPDISEEVEIPTNDIVSKKLNRTAYVIDWSLTNNNEKSMADNILARYKNVQPLGTNHDFNPGDALAFDVSSLDRMLGDNAICELLRSAQKAGVVMLMNGGSSADFARLCTMLGCFNPYPADSQAPSNGEQLLWVMARNLPSARSLYTCLSSYVDEAEPITISDADGSGTGDDASVPPLANDNAGNESGFISDYSQGQFCESIAGSIENALLPPANGKDDELTEMMEAEKVDIQYTYNWWRNNKDKKHPAHYFLELQIWNAYSERENRQYYFIHQEMTFNMKDAYIGAYHDAQWKTYGAYGKKFETSFYNNTARKSVIFHKHEPATTQSSRTYTSGVSFNIGGKVSTSGPEVSGGLNINHSSTYTIDDVVVTNNSVAAGDSTKANWSFEMRDAAGKYSFFSHAQVDFEDCCLAARSTFKCGTDYIFSVPQGTPNTWRLDFNSILRRVSCYGVANVGHPKTKYLDFNIHYSKLIKLPEVPVNPSK